MTLSARGDTECDIIRFLICIAPRAAHKMNAMTECEIGHLTGGSCT